LLRNSQIICKGLERSGGAAVRESLVEKLPEICEGLEQSGCHRKSFVEKLPEDLQGVGTERRSR
jgi:hypothetical protein